MDIWLSLKKIFFEPLIVLTNNKFGIFLKALIIASIEFDGIWIFCYWKVKTILYCVILGISCGLKLIPFFIWEQFNYLRSFCLQLRCSLYLKWLIIYLISIKCALLRKKISKNLKGILFLLNIYQLNVGINNYILI